MPISSDGGGGKGKLEGKKRGLTKQQGATSMSIEIRKISADSCDTLAHLS